MFVVLINISTFRFTLFKIFLQLLEGLKRKVYIFIGTKNIFNPDIYEKTKIYKKKL